MLSTFEEDLDVPEVHECPVTTATHVHCQLVRMSERSPKLLQFEVSLVHHSMTIE